MIGSYDPNDSSYWSFDERTDEDIEYEKRKKSEFLENLAKKEYAIIRSLAGCIDNFEIRSTVVSKILLEAEEAMIERYCKLEGLPYDFMFTARQKEGLRLLIFSFFRNLVRIKVDDNLKLEVNELIECSYRNNSNQIVYYRVNSIQSYLHKQYEKHTGKHSCLLPVEDMRNILSAIRLHLNVRDLRNQDLNYLIKQMKGNKIQYDKEMSQDIKRRHDEVASDKSFYPRWKARHMKSLVYFSPAEVRETYKKIFQMDISLKREEYISGVISILLPHEIRVYIRKNGLAG